MDRFALLEAKHNADIRPRPIINDVSMRVSQSGTVVISYSSRLSKAEIILGIAMMFGALELRWPGYQFRFRFPIPDDPPPLKRRSSKARRDWRMAFRWAARFLVTERMLAEVKRDGHEPWVLYESDSIHPEAIAYRVGVLPPVAMRT